MKRNGLLLESVALSPHHCPLFTPLLQTQACADIQELLQISGELHSGMCVLAGG